MATSLPPAPRTLHEHYDRLVGRHQAGLRDAMRRCDAKNLQRHQASIDAFTGKKGATADIALLPR
jgi:hypothetical protein